MKTLFALVMFALSAFGAEEFNLLGASEAQLVARYGKPELSNDPRSLPQKWDGGIEPFEKVMKFKVGGGTMFVWLLNGKGEIFMFERKDGISHKQTELILELSGGVWKRGVVGFWSEDGGWAYQMGSHLFTVRSASGNMARIDHAKTGTSGK